MSTLQIDFNALPIDALHRYLNQFDIVPDVDPLPTTALDPPHPSSLLHAHGRSQASTASPPLQPVPITPANRPRREPSASINRTRRSSRLLEDDTRQYLMPVVADASEMHGVLAQIAARHFRDFAVKEVDTLAAFMCAVKAKGELAYLIQYCGDWEGGFTTRCDSFCSHHAHAAGYLSSRLIEMIGGNCA